MFFPVFIDLEGREVLVIGAGKVAHKKIKKLVEYGPKITVYSKEIKNEEISKFENVKIILENIEADSEKIEKLVENYALVVAATDNVDLNDLIAEICIRKNILVNNVSSKTKMNAMFGGIVKNDEFQIAVSTNGVNCRRSRAMKSRVQKLLDEVENLGK